MNARRDKTSVWGYYLAFLLLLSLYSCIPGLSGIKNPALIDIQPPVIQSSKIRDEKNLVFEFDEPVSVVPEDVHIDPQLSIALVQTDPDKGILQISFAEAQTIGKDYVMRIKVSDASTNSLSFLYSFTGYNPRIPKILINEFNPQGSKSSPDCVELLVLSDGNIGGLLMVIGTQGEAVDSISFPDVEVGEGDYIVVHTKPEGLDGEIDETGPTNVSQGRLATDTGRDFWMDKAPGLPSNNGAISLYRQKGGDMIDAVLWSNRDDKPGDDNLGWTAASFPWAKDIGQAGHWESVGNIPMPSEAVDGTDSTATRSINRASDPTDTNTASDWHIVPTSGKTFGSVNNDEQYVR